MERDVAQRMTFGGNVLIFSLYDLVGLNGLWKIWL